MRVIGGRWGGRRLQAPKGRGTRPTADNVREAMFNILTAAGAFDEDDTRALDLFAGTGALGIEALSRGAGHATFVERARALGQLITSNLAALGAARDASEIVLADAGLAVRRLATAEARFHLIFVDPPYELAAAWAAEHAASIADLLAPGGLVVFESARRDPVAAAAIVAAVESSGRRAIVRTDRVYGDTAVLIVQATEEPG